MFFLLLFGLRPEGRRGFNAPIVKICAGLLRLRRRCELLRRLRLGLLMTILDARTARRLGRRATALRRRLTGFERLRLNAAFAAVRCRRVPKASFCLSDIFRFGFRRLRLGLLTLVMRDTVMLYFSFLL